MADEFMAYVGQVVTLADARRSLWDRYFTGLPCARGHIAQRRVASRSCCYCDILKGRRYAARHVEERNQKARERHAQHGAAYRKKNDARLKEDQARYRKNNPDLVKKRTKEFFDAHPSIGKKYSKTYFEKNTASILLKHKSYREKPGQKEITAAQRKIWSSKNKSRLAAKAAARRSLKLKATPLWANHDAIAAVYAECARVTAETGIEHHVDHIYPLKGRTVCGLHVENNLQILVGVENLAKGNRLNE